MNVAKVKSEEDFTTMEVQERRIVVVGLARSGIAAANRLSAMGARVIVTDSKSPDHLRGALERLRPEIEVETGGHGEATFAGADLVVVSPGVPLSIPPLREAKRKGIEVVSEIEVGYRLLPGEYIAVTGTNGKSTTVSLIGEMFREAGKKVVIAGNIGTPLISLGREDVEGGTVVVELSSFQLEGIRTFAPHVAVLLNISPDHLDRYPDMEAYAHAKARIFDNQGEEDFAIVNLDDPRVAALAEGLAVSVVPLSLRRPVAGGVYLAAGGILSTLDRFRGEVLRADEIRIQGVHNLENAMAATAAALVSGCDIDAVRTALKSYPGLPHRMEFVKEIDGVRFINDSKGTNIGAVLRSLESLQGTIHLIAGGQGKGTDYDALRPLVSERVKTLVLIGEAADKMEKDLEGTAEILRAATINEAVQLAFRRAVQGEVVLLSPACASFDMFTNFEERGKIFASAVERLRGRG